MNCYYVLSTDGDCKYESVTDYDVGNSDITALWSGIGIQGSYFDNVRLWVGDGQPVDIMGNPLSWTIVSDRFWSAISPLVFNDCQAFPAPLYHKSTLDPVVGYKVLNPTLSISATVNGVVESITNMEIDSSRIPPTTHMFRLSESSTVVIVSKDIVDITFNGHSKGLAYIKVKCGLRQE